MDSPVTLPNGQRVCSKHELVICGSCTVNYSFKARVSDDDDNDDDDDDVAPTDKTEKVNREAQAGSPAANGVVVSMLDSDMEKYRGTGRVFASVFTPPSVQPDSEAHLITPETLFRPRLNQCGFRAKRFINNQDREQMLVYADGACLNNGQPNPRAGWAFVFAPNMEIRGRLENHGPFGGPAKAQTSNRAELRAVIAVLRFRHWSCRGEGFKSIVVATDSEYVVNGATKWAKRWVKNGWKTSVRGAVKNKDLWELLLGEVERWDVEGLKVMFWRISKVLNSVAHTAAKEAAEEDADKENFEDVLGMGC